MIIIFDYEKVRALLHHIYTLSNVSVSLLDSEGIVQAGAHNEPYCIYVRDVLGFKFCLECDREACISARNSGTSYSYVCHALLNETITPIYVKDEIIAYSFIGQYVDVESEKSDQELLDFAIKNNLDFDKLKKLYGSVPRLDKNKLNSLIYLMDVFTKHMIMEQIIKLSNDTVIDSITQYIKDNVASELSTAQLCKLFYVSKNKLYSLFKKYHNMTVQKFITTERLSQAEKLLRTTELPISTISEKVGFSDYNNFIRLFKQLYGFPPLHYRKRGIPQE